MCGWDCGLVCKNIFNIRNMRNKFWRHFRDLTKNYRTLHFLGKYNINMLYIIINIVLKSKKNYV